MSSQDTRQFGTIALMGVPNAGKSTFINFLIGEKVSIVSDKAQTTRGLNVGVLTRGNCQIALLDLPGVHKPKHEMNRRMMKIVRQGLEDADLVFHIVDVTDHKKAGDHFIAQLIRERGVPYFLLPNKIDLVNRQKLIARLDDFNQRLAPDELIPVSSKTGENLERLLDLACEKMPVGEFRYEEDEYTNQSLRNMVCELIRERVLFFTHDEIPHATTIELEHFELDEEDDRYYIEALIIVEKPGQRRIVIGNQGSMLKKIRNGLNNSLSKLLLKPVSCELYVKVKSDWRNNSGYLDKMEF